MLEISTKKKTIATNIIENTEKQDGREKAIY